LISVKRSFKQMRALAWKGKRQQKAGTAKNAQHTKKRGHFQVTSETNALVWVVGLHLVEGVEAEVARGAVHLEHVHGRHFALVEDVLDCAHAEHDLEHHAGTHLGHRRQGGWVGVGLAGQVHELRHHHAHHRQHGHAAVLELRFPQPLCVVVNLRLNRKRGVEMGMESTSEKKLPGDLI